jgi:NAD-dependent DNA ligase
VSVTGFRDPEFINLVNRHGFDCNDKYGVTKSTAALIAADKNSTSSKIKNAKKYGIPIYTRDEFVKLYNINLQ